MKRALFCATALALLLPAPALADRFAIGLERGASADAVAARVARATGGSVARLTPFALVLRARSASGVDALSGVSYVERLDRSRRLAFSPNDPLVKKQWYLGAIRAFDAFEGWPVRPALPHVKVAVIDSGIDGSHPEFDHRIAGARSFVDNYPRRDAIGHGTFVAGVMGAALNNSTGIAGIAFPSKLLVAKVVRDDGAISPEAEARAIKWAVDEGAQVINLSLAALRDPTDRRNDFYSPLEASAIDYAVRNGVVVVAAVGNGDGAPTIPWRFASYPAALPHVIGVGAATRDGAVPEFSNRDAVYTDLTAPGVEIVSTVPRWPGSKPACADEIGYSIASCGPDHFRRGEGTSFAAAQVSSAAALLLAERPGLAPEQVGAILERSAGDLDESSGCKRCTTGRDESSGWGVLNIAAALTAAAGTGSPPVDDYEPNDDVGTRAATIVGRYRKIEATLDYWDDATDIYRVFLRRGQRLDMRLDFPSGMAATLALWQPGTKRLTPAHYAPPRKPLRETAATAVAKELTYRARTRGWHFVQVKASEARTGFYALDLFKS